MFCISIVILPKCELHCEMSCMFLGIWEFMCGLYTNSCSVDFYKQYVCLCLQDFQLMQDVADLGCVYSDDICECSLGDNISERPFLPLIFHAAHTGNGR